MSKEAMKLALEHAKRDERHMNHAETRYWCRMYRDIAEKAVEALAKQPAQQEPLTDEQIDLLINGRGDEDDDDYVEPTGDGFGLTDADLVKLVRRVEAAHHIKEKNT